MIPILQIRNGQPGGNCLQAALASLFERSLDDVPDFASDENRLGDWWTAMQTWLRSAWGLAPVYFSARTSDGCLPAWTHYQGWRPPGWSLAHGKSRRGLWHVVVCRDGDLAHDPHPSRQGLAALDGFLCFFPLSETWRRLLESAQAAPK